MSTKKPPVFVLRSWKDLGNLPRHYQVAAREEIARKGLGNFASPVRVTCGYLVTAEIATSTEPNP